ncbi:MULTISPECIES: hypothetical protein [unclassified Bradyrhizobium]|uniref:hypothetical protein n=1 Tax=unclassified Bradyrhizobium TaxID=2631580 RepID=UPI003D232745
MTLVPRPSLAAEARSISTDQEGALPGAQWYVAHKQVILIDVARLERLQNQTMIVIGGGRQPLVARHREYQSIGPTRVIMKGAAGIGRFDPQSHMRRLFS